MKKKLLTSLVFLVCSFTFAQAPDTLWTKTFGDTGDDYGLSVQQTSDGGYIVAGVTNSFGAGGSDVWLIKTNASGDTLWTKTFGGIYYDQGNSVQQTTDGGYIIAGETSSFGAGYSDLWLIKTDSSGNTHWTKTFGGIYFDQGNSVQQTTDGGYIIVGSTESFGAGVNDIWLIKTNDLGDTLWTKTFGGSNIDWGQSLNQTIDGGYIVTGYTESYGSGFRDIWLIKTTAFGDSLWTKTFGDTGDDYGLSVQQTTDGSYLIVGNKTSIGSATCDVWLIKTDVYGDTLWTKTFGGSNYDGGSSVQQTNDGGYIVAGFTDSFGAGYRDIWLIKTNTFGDSLWAKTFGGNDDDYGLVVQQTTDEGYIIVGRTSSFGAGSEDIWLIKTTPDINGVEQNNEIVISDFSLEQNYPNPFNPSTNISWQVPEGGWQTLKIYDVLGNEVATLVDEYKSSGSYKIEWDASEFPSGVYFYQLLVSDLQSKDGKAENYVETKKMILLK